MPLRQLSLLRRHVDDASIEGHIFASERTIEPPVAGAHVRVVSWNIALGRRLHGVHDHLRSSPNLSGAHVIALQEVSRSRHSSQARTLASRLGMNYVYAGAHRCLLGQERGQAILTPYPILRSWRVVLPQVRQPRIALAADLLVGDQVLRVINAHLENRGRLHPFIIAQRAAQLTHLLEWMESAGEARTVLVGDLNTVGFILDRGRSEVLSSVLERAGFRDAHDGDPRATFRMLNTRLDWIYARHAIPVRAAIEDTGRLSDHLAVWADLSLDSLPLAS